MSRETVVCTTSWPSLRSASASSVCVEIGRSRTSRRIAACRSWRFIAFSTSVEGLERTVDLVVADDERRREAQDVRAGREADEAGVERRVDERLRRARRARRRRAGRRRAPRRRAAGRRGRRGAARRSRAPARAASSSIVVARPRARRRTTTGLPPNVEPWSPGANAPAASSATSRQPIGRPFASPLASVTRSGSHAELLEGEERARCGRRRSAPRRRRAARRARRERGGCEELRRRAGSRRPRRAPARAGSSPTSSDIAACSESTSFGCAKRAPGSSGSNAARFAGWPVTASAPVVRPWKLCSSAITPGLPVALRAYFSAASFASAPELQKNACAPPKRVGERARERVRGLGAVEVRRVPEPVELRVRGGERRRMPVAERRRPRCRRRSRDSGGPSSSVSQHAVAVDERDARRADTSAAARSASARAHATTAVTPISAASAAARRDRRGEQLRDDAAVERAARRRATRAVARRSTAISSPSW